MRSTNATNRLILLAAVAAIVPLTGAVAASGATYYWDPNHTFTTTGGGIDKGSAIWDTTSLNWYPGTGSVDVAWPNTGTDVASFYLPKDYTYVQIGNGDTISAQQVEITAYGYTFTGTNTGANATTLNIAELTIDPAISGLVANQNSSAFFNSGTVNITNVDTNGDTNSQTMQVNGAVVNFTGTLGAHLALNIDAGTLNLNSAAQMPTATSPGSQIYGGTLNTSVDIATAMPLSRLINTMAFGGGHTLEFSNASAAPNGNFAPNVLVGSTVQFDGNEANSTSAQAWTLAKYGPGSLILTGKYYSYGATTVGLQTVGSTTSPSAGGTLEVDGSFNINTHAGLASDFVVNNGILQGKGTIAGTVTVGNTYATTLGNAVLSAGIGNSLTTGALTFVNNGTTNNAVYSVDINSSTLLSGDVVVNGNLALGNGVAALNVTDLGSAVLTGGQVFTILNPGSGYTTTGYFFGDPTGTNITVGLNTFTISYSGGANGNAVTLTSVATNIPEPATLGLLAVGGLMLLVPRSKRRTGA